ncbi:MAG: secondary thiamine-phosphate synthase enzyme YjbQ [Thermoproteota archaeon]|nr:secondary thiamine-phosphate synthase enzyme YjbQ [Thermoproteota archaeon]
MKVFSDSFEFSTKGEFDFVDLSSEVNSIIRKSGIEQGVALVFAGHATGVIVITEYESGLLQDIAEFLEDFIPASRGYHHPGNAFAHLRSMFLAPSKVVPVRDGRLALGTWQSIFWVEAERRPRTRRVEVYVIGGER